MLEKIIDSGLFLYFSPCFRSSINVTGFASIDLVEDYINMKYMARVAKIHAQYDPYSTYRVYLIKTTMPTIYVSNHLDSPSGSLSVYARIATNVEAYLDYYVPWHWNFSDDQLADWGGISGAWEGINMRLGYLALLERLSARTLMAAENTLLYSPWVIYYYNNPWTWSSWWNDVQGSDYLSYIDIEAHESRMYMGTVQGYVQGLLRGSIGHNCTFIPITIYPLETVVCLNGNINYTTTIQYVDHEENVQNIRQTYTVSPQFKPLSLDSSFWNGSTPYDPSEALHIVNEIYTPIGWFMWFAKHVQLAKPVMAYSGQVSLDTYIYFPHIPLAKRFPKLGYLGSALFVVNLGVDIVTQSWGDVFIDILTYALVYTGNPYAIALALGISAGWSVYNYLTGLGWSPVSAGILGFAVGAAVTIALVLLILWLVIMLV